MEQQDYYKVGTKEDITISNSSLTYINPEQGGSPLAFLNFFEVNKEETEKQYKRTGILIHKWAEDRKGFCVSSVNKPTEKLGQVADLIVQQVKEGALHTDELALACAKAINYQSNWKDDTILKNVNAGTDEYVQEMIKCYEDNLIFLTKVESETIDNCTTSIRKHKLANELLFMVDNDFSNKKTYKELEIYWSKEFENLVNKDNIGKFAITVKFKAKLDDLTIDFENKKIILNDPKTTSSGAYSFYKSFESWHYYRQIAFYIWAIKEWAKQNDIDLTDFTWECNNIAIETSGLYQVVVWRIPQEWIDKGKKEYQELVQRVVWHIANKEWSYTKEEIENGYMTIPLEL